MPKGNMPFKLLYEERMTGAVGITDECHIIGIAGHCGDDCPLYKEGKCPEQDECDEHSVENVKEFLDERSNDDV